MSVRRIHMLNVTAVLMISNSMRGPKYSSTIHNRTSQNVIVVVSNQDMQAPFDAALFVNPVGGGLVAVPGAVVRLNEPYASVAVVIGVAGGADDFVFWLEGG